MVRWQSMRKARNALVILAIFMVVLRFLRPDSSASPAVDYSAPVKEDPYVGKDTQAQPAAAAVNDKAAKAEVEQIVAAGDSASAFDVRAAYAEIISTGGPVVIFSKSYCPFSAKAKELLLEKHRIVPTPTVVELDLHEHMNEMQDLLKEITGRRTVPNIVVNGVSHGGASDLVELGDQLAAKLIEWGDGKITVEALTAHVLRDDGKPQL